MPDKESNTIRIFYFTDNQYNIIQLLLSSLLL